MLSSLSSFFFQIAFRACGPINLSRGKGCVFLILALMGARGTALAEAQTPREFPSIKSLLSTARKIGPGGPVKVSGVVTYVYLQRTIFIQDSTGGLLAGTTTPNAVRVGDQVNATGTIKTNGFSAHLGNSTFEVLGPGRMPEATRLTARDILSGEFDMRLIEIDGELESEPIRREDRLILQFSRGGVFFTADVAEAGDPAKLAKIQVHSKVRLRGVCTIPSAPYSRPTTFRVLLRGPENVLVLRSPPLWRHHYALPAVIGSIGFGLAALVWSASLRYQVRRKTAELRSLNETLESRIQQRTAQLERANRELELFGSSVSHDLKAPLRAIAGFAAQLEEEHAPKIGSEGAHLLFRIADGASRMNHLIEALLEFSKCSSLPCEPAPLDTSTLVQECFHLARTSEPHRLIQLKLNPLPRIMGDPLLIRQVFLNLLSNAFKYTRAAQPASVEVGFLKDTQPPAIFISDNGVGFDMRETAKLFTPFYRMSTSKGIEGSGLGLALVSRIVRRHEGSVWAESSPGGGATFYIALPLCDPPPGSKRES